MLRRLPIPFHVPLVLLLPALLLPAGCGGDRLPRRAVSGSVTLDGQPLAGGNIDFQPVEAGGVSSGTIIQNGRYAISRDRGLPPGSYRVKIFSTGEALPAPGELPGPVSDYVVPEELIPAKYNLQTTLEVEVPARGPTVFDFELFSTAP